MNCKLGFIWIDSDSASGTLKVKQACRARRTILVYAGVGGMNQVGRAVSRRNGSWEVDFPSFSNPLVFVLLPKKVGRKTCGGSAASQLLV